MAALLGKDDIFFVHNGTTYLPVGCLTSNSYDKTRDFADGTVTKCNTTPSPIPQKSSYETSFEAIADDDIITKIGMELIESEMENDEPSYWKTQRKGVDYKFGKGYFTAVGSQAPADGEITWNASLRGDGLTSITDLKLGV